MLRALSSHRSDHSSVRFRPSSETERLSLKLYEIEASMVVVAAVPSMSVPSRPGIWSRYSERCAADTRAANFELSEYSVAFQASLDWPTIGPLALGAPDVDRDWVSEST